MVNHALICKRCNTLICSETRYDFVACRCGWEDAAFVDGGNGYFRYGGVPVQKGDVEYVIYDTLTEEIFNLTPNTKWSLEDE